MQSCLGIAYTQGVEMLTLNPYDKLCCGLAFRHFDTIQAQTLKAVWPLAQQTNAIPLVSFATPSVSFTIPLAVLPFHWSVLPFH
jgi:hypothetical protein